MIEIYIPLIIVVILKWNKNDFKNLLFFQTDNNLLVHKYY